ncbi:hypothetical protein [Alloyangia pacifica]|uniref:Uncharacterized protein n=1 Tax=Alloyangia pacifica TaxID=311180 RepID=A0A1I6PQW6_9RHOB|nr:hypothetical protein [Alloyangia pacifica]SDG33471.1 hypothetical protein SAMN04488245_102405 [Alloyangia pacifica]SFS42576.1 hypothetical protein SAMN04488050_101706 [Alloyangia pacifica]
MRSIENQIRELTTDGLLGMIRAAGRDAPSLLRRLPDDVLADLTVCIEARERPVYIDDLLIMIAAAIARCLKEDDAQTAREWAELFGVPARSLPERVARGFITAALHRNQRAA